MCPNHPLFARRADVANHINSNHSFKTVSVFPDSDAPHNIKRCTSCLQFFVDDSLHFNTCKARFQSTSFPDLEQVYSLSAQQIGREPNDSAALFAAAELQDLDYANITSAPVPTITELPTAVRHLLSRTFHYLVAVAIDSHNSSNTRDNAFKLIAFFPKLLLCPPAKCYTRQKLSEKLIRRLLYFWQGNFKNLDTDSDAARVKAHAYMQDRDNTQVHLPARNKDQLNQEIIRQVNLGALHRAAELAAASTPVANPSHANAEQRLLEVFPSASFPDQLNCQDTKLITAEQVTNAIKFSKKGSAPAFSGLRFDHLRALLQFHIANPVAELLNSILLQRIPDRFNSLLRTGICTMLSKDEQCSRVRPIVVMESYVRLLSKAIAWASVPDLIKHLPHQLGVGHRGGLQTAILASRVMSEKDPTDIKALLDLSNAFNSVSRATIRNQLDSILANDHPIRAYFNLMYCSPVCAKTRGDAHVLASSGVLQGDPLSPFLFCVALTPILNQAFSVMQEKLGSVIAYIDDIQLHGPPDRVALAISTCRQHAAEAGLELNIKKCTIYNPSNTSLPDDPVFNQITEKVADGVRVLGSPVGTAAFESDFCQDVVQRAVPQLKNIVTLPFKQAAFVLIKHCFPAKINHLLRTVPGKHVAAAARKMDKLVRSAIQTLAASTDTGLEPNCLKLPRFRMGFQAFDQPNMQSFYPFLHLSNNEGGLGFQNTLATAPLAFLAAFCEAQSPEPKINTLLQTNYIPQQGPTFDSLTASLQLIWSFVDDKTRGKYFQDQQEPSIATIFEHFKSVPTKNLQKSWSKWFLSKLASDFKTCANAAAIAGCADPQKELETKRDIVHPLLRLTSQSMRNAMAWSTVIPSTPLHRLRNDQFTFVLRDTLGLSLVFQALRDANLACGILTAHASSACKAVFNNHHVRHAPHQGGAAHRHTAVQNVVHALLKAGGFQCSIAPRLVSANPNEEVFADLLIEFDAHSQLILDFSIVSPDANNLLNTKNLLKKGHAAELRAQEKKHHYNTKTPTIKVTPVIFESSSGWHESATTTIWRLTSSANHFVPTPASATWASISAIQYYTQAISVQIMGSRAIDMIRLNRRVAKLRGCDAIHSNYAPVELLFS